MRRVARGEGGQGVCIGLAQATHAKLLVALEAAVQQLRLGREKGEVTRIVAIEREMVIDAPRLMELRHDHPVELALERTLVQGGHVLRLHVAPHYGHLFHHRVLRQIEFGCTRSGLLGARRAQR